MREAPIHNIGAYCKKGDRILNLEYVLPEKIEERSFEIIASELGDIDIPEENLPVLMRVIHTTADFDYVKNLKFSDGAVKKALDPPALPKSPLYLDVLTTFRPTIL